MSQRRANRVGDMQVFGFRNPASDWPWCEAIQANQISRLGHQSSTRRKRTVTKGGKNLPGPGCQNQPRIGVGSFTCQRQDPLAQLRSNPEASLFFQAVEDRSNSGQQPTLLRLQQQAKDANGFESKP